MGDQQVPGEVLIDAASAYLVDLDGTLYTELGPVPGAASVIRELRRRGVPFRFVTNTTRRPRRRLLERLEGYGLDAAADEVFTAVLAGAAYLKGAGVRTVAPYVPEDVLEDLAGFTLKGGVTGPATGPWPDAVLIGDLGARWDHALLNEAFRYVMDGARLVALQRGRYWLAAEGIELDAGAYVAALEYATGREAVVCGKPNPHFFQAAVASMQVTTDRPPVVVIGDDIWSDIEGAQRAGFRGWLVRTGKFRRDELRSSGVRPDRVLDSIADLGAQGE